MITLCKKKIENWHDRIGQCLGCLHANIDLIVVSCDPELLKITFRICRVCVQCHASQIMFRICRIQLLTCRAMSASAKLLVVATVACVGASWTCCEVTRPPTAEE